jgi:alkylation response protein AidB-like acyl-CoA dehydrogenase
MEAAMAELYVSEFFVKSCLDGIQIHGGTGFLAELQLEREPRDSLALLKFGGTLSPESCEFKWLLPIS